MENSINFYPVIRFPEQLHEITNTYPPIPSKPIEPKLKLPVEPNSPTSTTLLKTEKSESAFWSIIAGIIGAIAFNGFIIYFAVESEAYWIFAIYALLVISIPFTISSRRKEKQESRKRAHAEFQRYLTEKKRYPERVKEAHEIYNAEIINYNIALRDYNINVDNLKNPEVIKEYRKELLLEYYNSITRPTLYTGNFVTGASEDFFKEYLKKYFEGYIHDNYSIIDESWIKEESNIYKPDFIFWDLNSIVIDIEIDEPYIITTGEPIHWDGQDDIRNFFFNNNNWIVIRFSEDQILKQPNECCYLIALIIKQFNKDLNFLSKFSSDCTIPQKRIRWTEEDAHRMAYKRVRDSWLSNQNRIPKKGKKANPPK